MTFAVSNQPHLTCKVLLMKKELNSWYSPSLNKEMPVATYGDYGFALLLVPTAAADYLEYERFQLMHHIAPFINEGKVKVFSIDSINNESWLNNHMDPRHKSVRHQQWNDYVFNEVVPLSGIIPARIPRSLPVVHLSVLCIV